MASNNSDGSVVIEVIGDNSELAKSLTNAKTQISDFAGELNLIEKSLELNPGNIELINQKFNVLGNEIIATKDKLDILKKAEQDFKEKLVSGKISEQQYNSLRREILNTEAALRDLTNEYENMVDESVNIRQSAKLMENFADETKKASQEVMTFGDLLKSNVFGNLLADGLQAAGGAVADFVKDGVELASNLQEVQNVVDTTFGAGATQIYEWSNAAAESFGMSSLSAQKFNGTLGAMLKSMGITDEAVMKMSTDMVGLAGDMASFYNLDIEQAFDKIRAGISGETEPLKQLGINMSVANLEAYALANGIETAYEKMSQAEQAQLRYNYLMSVTADAQGDFAKTSDSYANQQRILQLNIENLSATMGQSLLPVLNETITLVNDKLPEAGPAIEKLGEALGGMFEFVIDNHEAILAFGGAIGTYTVVTKGAAAATKLFTAATSMTPVGWVATIVGATVALVGLADALSDTSGNYKEWIEDANQGIAEQENKVNDLEDELQAVNAKIEEIQAKGKLTITDEAELARLRLQNDELSTQLAIEQEILKTKQQQKEADALDMLYDNNGYEGSIAYAKEQVEAYKNLQEELQFWRDEQAKGAESEYDSTYIDAMIADRERLEEDLKLAALESVQAAQAFSGMLSGTTEESKEAQAAVDELGNSLLAYFDEIDTASNEAVEKAQNLSDGHIKSPAEIAAENVASVYRAEAEAIANGTNENLVENAYKDFEESFKNRWKAAEHAYAVGNTTEVEMWEEKRKLLNLYGDETKEEYWKYYEDLIKYDKNYAAEQAKISEEAAKKEAKAFEKQYEEQKDIVNEGLSDIIEEHEKAYDAIAKKREEYSKKLMSIGGDLFTVDVSEDENGKEVTTYTVNNLEKQLRKMREYHRQITELKKQGASEELLSEINSLGAEESSQFAKYLSSMSDAEFAEINRLYNEKQALADELSADLYKSEAQAISDSMTTALAELANNSSDYGIQAADSYVDAFISEFDERYEEIAALLENTNIGAEILATVEAETAYYSSKALAGTTYKEEASAAVNVGGKLDVERLVEGINKPIQIVLDGKVIAESTLKYEGQYKKQTGG